MPVISLVPGQVDVQTTLRAFLLGILPSGIEVIRGQDNRVPEPAGTDFVVMTPIRRERIERNVDQYIDSAFTASIAGTVLSVTDMLIGTVAVGTTLFGTGVAPGTVITALASGTGGTGTYTVSKAQQVSSSKMAAGIATMLQPVKVVTQLDVHGPNSSDNAQIISTALFDEYAIEQFAALDPNVYPLYAEDPKQIPFINAEQQVEYRWVVEALVQANQTVSVPQQFFDTITVSLIVAETTH